MSGMARADTRYTEADIIALKQRMKTGLEKVRASDGKEATYQGYDADVKLLTRMEADVYGRSRVRRRVQSIVIKSEGS